MIFGVFAPQGWKMELAGIEDPQDKWAVTVRTAQLAEELGLDSIWVYDHVHNVPVPAHETVFECWTTIAALAASTSRIRLGQMVSCAAYRNPALVAKITSTVDVISGGRLDFGIGAGWYDQEFRSYGYEFPPAADRIRYLRETVEVVKLMWSEPDATYEGRFVNVAGAQCDPKPVQDPHPPIWIGGGGEQLTLRVVARHADRSNFGGSPEEWAHKRDVLRAHCADVGRDPDEITMTWSPEIHIRETEQEIVEGGSRSFWGEPFESWRAGNLVGTPEQVCERIAEYQALGCGGLVPWCSDYPDDTTLRLLGTRVIPELRS
ncbi:LLM class F420-dependent oxidoreductase [Dermatobacter hominis]|uniref:LLM class F420-dependent oxidoreductase n=1 Tax=Dermatobacter hominis TaxID=2884263 RepID=UPI001D122630|nr:LLM class F420-dependent oxidoreductase [Dermatobacter hominis]UDY36015.1 LLM class F420-dependent oxidoreductase [Dermatobacter hominis]